MEEEVFNNKNSYSKSHNWLWIILSLLALVILILVIYILVNKSTKIEECEKFDNIAQKYFCYVNVVLQKQDISLCNNFEDKNLLENCRVVYYSHMAVNKSDSSFCKKIDLQEAQDSCYRELAVKLNNEKMCEEISNRSITDISLGQSSHYDECYAGVAYAKNSSTLCDKILGDNKRNYCYNFLAGNLLDSTICAKIKGNYSDYYLSDCYFRLARWKKDISLCENLKEENNKHDCYREVAFTSKKIEYCNKLPDSTETNKVDFVPENAGQSRFMGPTEGCYSGVIQVSNTTEVCAKILSNYIKEYCFVQIAQNAKNPSLCDGNRDQVIRNKCYHDSSIYIILNTPVGVEFCARVADTALRDDCYYSLAFYRKNKTVCDNIVTPSSKDWCYKNVDN